MSKEVRGFAMGTLILSCVCRGTSTLSGNKSFRVPYGLFFVIPSIVMVLIFFIPESPRWLLTKNRTAEARANLGKLLHGKKTGTEIDEEFAALQYANLKRTAIIVGMNFFQQATGQAFASTYGAIFIRVIGTVNSFTMTIVISIINLAAVPTALYLVDRLGRRPLLFTSAIWMFCAIVTMGALGTVASPSIGKKSGIIAMLVLFSSGYTFAFAPLNYVITTKIPSLRLRDASQRTASIVNVVTNFAVSFSIPCLLYDEYAGLQSRVGFVFAGVLALAIGFVFFCVPECKGKSLEQVDALFNEGEEKGVELAVVKHEERA
ncbi:general substrate transporter [Aspergillus germanicus]